MSAEQNSHLPVRLRTLAQLISIGVMLAGALVLAGWMLDIAVLKSVIPGWVTMKANTALAFVLAGVSLLLLRTEPAPKSITRTKVALSKLEIAKRVVGQACSVVVSLIGLLTLSEYLFGLDLGI